MNNVSSPRTDDAGLEARLAKSPAPRVKPSDLQDAIASEHYFSAADGLAGNDPGSTVDSSHPWEHLKLLTFCVLVLRNGFTVTGESACASPENFDEQIGRDIARKNAVEKMWPLLGFALKQRLHDSTRASE